MHLANENYEEEAQGEEPYAFAELEKDRSRTWSFSNNYESSTSKGAKKKGMGGQESKLFTNS